MINGAPARGHAAADMGRAGYEYDAGLQVQRMPLAPLAASFLERSAEPWRGDMSLSLVLKGRGTTGVNLRQHLEGHLRVEVAHAALQIKQLLAPGRGTQPTAAQQFLRVVVGILDPLLNAVGTALGMPNLVAQPFEISRLHLEMGQGRIAVQDFMLASDTIIVGSRGSIPMADELMRSPLDLPVEIALARSLAQRFQVGSAPSNATHVKLPDFVVVRGTLEQPQTRLNTKALAGTALQQVGRQVGGEAGTVLQGLGNLLGGGTRPVTNAPGAVAPPAAKAPGTNAPINHLLDDLFRPRPKP